MKLSFIGLGVMGYPMAGHLQRAGHIVTVFNRTQARAVKWAGEYGGATAATPAEAARDADIVFSCVGRDADLRQVTLGEGGAFAAMKPGAAVRGSHHRFRHHCARAGGGGGDGGVRIRRCAGFGRRGGRGQRQAHHHVRRRRESLCARRTGDGGLCPADAAAGPVRGRPAHQDGQPDLHCRRGAGARRRLQPGARLGPRYRGGGGGDLQGRGAKLADGESPQDHGGGPLRSRLRRGMDAQGSRHLS